MKSIIAVTCMFMLLAFTASAQELSIVNGKNATKENLKNNDSISLGEENFLGGTMQLFTNKGIGVSLMVEKTFSRFDTLAAERTHIEAGLAYRYLNDCGGLKMYHADIQAEFEGGYLYDKHLNKMTYLYSDNSTKELKKTNSSEGLYFKGDFRLYGDENKARVFGALDISASLGIFLRSDFITRFGDDTLTTKYNAEDLAASIYRAKADLEIGAVPLGEKLSLALNGFYEIGNQNNFEFGFASTFGVALKMNVFSEKETSLTTLNQMLNVVSVRFYQTNYTNCTALGGDVSVNLVGLLKAIKKH